MESKVIKCSTSPDGELKIYKVGRLTLSLLIRNDDTGLSIHLDRDTAEELATALIEFFDELDQED